MSVLVFTALGIWTGWSSEPPQGDQIRALFGSFALGLRGYLGIAGLVLVVILLAAITARLAVLAHIRDLEVYSRRR